MSNSAPNHPLTPLERLWRFCFPNASQPERQRLLQPGDYVQLEALCRAAGVQVLITTDNLNENRITTRLFPNDMNAER